MNIDGKTKKLGGIRVISAFVGEHQLTLGEIKSENKRTEIKEIPKLLDMIDVKGHIVTIDSNRSAKKHVYEAGHGRVEQREYWLESDINWLAKREDWTDLRSVGMVKTIVTRKEKTTRR